MTRAKLLLLLVVAFIGAAWYAWQETPRQQRVSNVKKSIAVRADEAQSTAFAADEKNLLPADNEASTYKKPKRDLFRALYRRSAVKRQVRAPEPVVVESEYEPIVEPVVVETPTFMNARRGTQPVPQLNVLGYLRKDFETTVFLATAQGDIHLVKQGQSFADGLYVRSITDGQMVISRGPQGDGVAIRISEKKNQRMPIPADLTSERPQVPVFVNPVPNTETPQSEPGEVEVNP